MGTSVAPPNAPVFVTSANIEYATSASRITTGFCAYGYVRRSYFHTRVRESLVGTRRYNGTPRSGSGDLDLRPIATFKQPKMPLAVLELTPNAKPPLSRALVFSDASDFSLDKVMALGVWRNPTRLLLPAAENTPTSRKNGRELRIQRFPKVGMDGRPRATRILRAPICH